MNLWEKIKYGLWPALKMKLKVWWYSIVYGGKKNIPPDMLFGEMARSMEKLQENLVNALRNMPEDIPSEDKEKLLEALQLTSSLDADLERAGEEANEKFKNQQDN